MLLRLCLLLMLASLLPAMALPNGKFVFQQGVEDPDIPVQRAAIRFADGVQTLVVESTFVAKEAAEVAWILPLPAEPTEFDVASPGLIETMAFQFGPGVHRPIRGESMIFEAAVFLFLVLLAVGIAFSHRLVEWVLVCAVIGLLALIAVPNFLEAGTRGIGATTDADLQSLLKQRLVVGDYDVAVLSPRSAGEMDTWLQQNGFGALETGMNAAIGDYIAEGWCFMASRLKGDVGANSPHPLSVTFPTDRAVYPMRLTGQGARENTRVDLFVFGPGIAQHGRMREVVSGTLDWRSETGPSPRRWRTVGSRDTGEWIATMHAGIIDLAEDAAVMTRLSRSFKPAEMRASDVWLDFESVDGVHFHRKMLHPDSSRPWMMARWAMGFIALGSLLGATLWRFKSRRWAGTSFVAGLLIGVLSAGMVAALGNFVPVREYDLYALQRGGNFEYAVYRMDPEIMEQFTSSVQSLDDAMAGLLAYGTNVYTGDPIREVDSPGNFILRTREDGERVIVGMSHSGEEREYTWEEVRGFFQ